MLAGSWCSGLLFRWPPSRSRGILGVPSSASIMMRPIRPAPDFISLRSSATSLCHPFEYTYLYYAHYPVLQLGTYPPVFYLAEAIGFLIWLYAWPPAITGSSTFGKARPGRCTVLRV